MRHVNRSSVSPWWLPGLVLLRTGAVVACVASGAGTGCIGAVDYVPTGGAGAGGAATGVGVGGAGAGSGAGGVVVSEAPCTGPADPRLVVAPQRILRLTMVEVVNTIRSLIDATAATSILNDGGFGQIGNEQDRSFPPLNGTREGVQIDDAKFLTLDGIAAKVGKYVFDNFATVTKCPATPTDACATTYLNNLAASAYRRPLTSGEQSRLTGLYNGLKTMNVNGYAITSTIQEATQNAVYAILSSPQMLYRTELGTTPAAATATSPAGVPLTQNELATELAFFLTDAPPDATLLDLANRGMLTAANVPAQVSRIMATQAAKDWLSTIMFTFYKLNLLYNVATTVDGSLFPEFNGQLLTDMHTEAQKFLDNALWGGNLVDLLTSRTTFLNSNLASVLYKVPVPAGASATNFVQTTLPADQRAGMLTNAGFLTSRARSNRGSVVARGLVIQETMLCIVTPGPPDSLKSAVAAAMNSLDTQTVHQQVASRANGICGACHSHFDPFGLVLDNYDDIGKYRTIDDLGGPVDSTTSMPVELGGEPVTNAIDFAQKLAANPGFTNCMAETVLQYAMTDIFSAPVNVPTLPGITPVVAGCATADVAQRYGSATTKTFGDIVRAVAASPAFALRTPAL
jgi:hypothetical protein